MASYKIYLHFINFHISHVKELLQARNEENGYYKSLLCSLQLYG